MLRILTRIKIYLKQISFKHFNKLLFLALLISIIILSLIYLKSFKMVNSNDSLSSLFLSVLPNLIAGLIDTVLAVFIFNKLYEMKTKERFRPLRKRSWDIAQQIYVLFDDLVQEYFFVVKSALQFTTEEQELDEFSRLFGIVDPDEMTNTQPSLRVSEYTELRANNIRNLYDNNIELLTTYLNDDLSTALHNVIYGKGYQTFEFLTRATRYKFAIEPEFKNALLSFSKLMIDTQNEYN